MRRTRVYIAGPIANGGKNPEKQTGNVTKAMHTAAQLLKEGYAPLCPHLTAFLDPAGFLPHEVWIESDLAWLSVADVVLRLPGVSKGADMETTFAKDCGITIFHSVKELVRIVPKEQRNL